MFVSSNQHQFREGSIVFRTDCNTGEVFYKIAFLRYGDLIMPELPPEIKVKNKEHQEALKRCENIGEIFQVERKFGFIRK